jgi:hypothetical protein
VVDLKLFFLVGWGRLMRTERPSPVLFVYHLFIDLVSRNALGSCWDDGERSRRRPLRAAHRFHRPYRPVKTSPHNPLINAAAYGASPF